MAPYDGPHAIPGIRFRAIASALGITAWGMNVLELDPACERYPQHDHEKDGQERVRTLQHHVIPLANQARRPQQRVREYQRAK